MTDRPEGARCPVTDEDFRLDRPGLWHYGELGRLREESEAHWNTQCGGFWMLHRYEHVREALQRPDVFTNDTISPFHRDQELRLVPQILNPPEHVHYRHVLNPWFSPGAVARLVPVARAHCATRVDELAGHGGCDFVTEFALRLPTDLFLAYLGLPIEDGERVVPWVETIFAAFFGGDQNAAGRAIGQIYRYFDAATAEREADPRDPSTDFVSHLLRATIDGKPLPRSEILTICLTLTLAGLDTTRAQLGFIFHHLATHDADRRLLTEQPDRIPLAIEEFLRLYTLILTAGRRVAANIDFHGCPMKAGDVVWLGLLSANRDPRRFDDADRFVVDRQPNPHLAFAAGAHRCLGAHLARAELAVVIEEWHRRIPDYRIAPDQPVIERGGQLTLRHLPLRWEA